MDNKAILAGMWAANAPYEITPDYDPGNLFPECAVWTPSRPNKHTAKLKRKRRARNKIARESRKRNRK